jgi:hypothetical protein
MEYCVRVQGEEVKLWAENDFQLEITLNSIRFASPSSEVTIEWKEKNKTFSRVYKPWNQEIEQLELETL